MTIMDDAGMLTEQAAGVLEAHWQGMTAYEYAKYSGEDPIIVATIMDVFETEGW